MFSEIKRHAANCQADMATFSRGCIRILSRPLQPPNCNQFQFQFQVQFLTTSLHKPSPPRPFTTKSILYAPPKPRPKTKAPHITITRTPKATKQKLPFPMPAKQTPEDLPSPSTTQESYMSYLASKATPTLLYTAPSQLSFKVASFTSAFFCLTYTAYCYESVILYGPSDLAPWVKMGFTGICTFTGLVGVYLVMGPSRIIKKIFAVPAIQILGGGGGGGSGGGISGRQSLLNMKKRSNGTGTGITTTINTTTSPPITLEIHLSSLLPSPLTKLNHYLPPLIRPTTIISIPSSSITLPQPLSPLVLSPGPRPPTPEEIEREKEEEVKRKWKWKNSIWSRPFQEFGSGAAVVGRAIKRVVTREGFIDVEVEGEEKRKRTYKLDVLGGWMRIDGGRGSLDRLCKIRKA